MAARTKYDGLVEYGLSSYYQMRTGGLLSCVVDERASSPTIPNQSTALAIKR